MGFNLTKQQKSALNIERHISLTANAGSGKTFVLKNRFVNILLQEGVSLNNIVAITFTEKAAAKLYKDIAEEIDRRIKEEENKEKVFLLQSYRRDLVSANISTIHSFCIQLLKEFSTEAKIDANFVPIDEIMSKELIRLSYEAAFKLISKDSEEIAKSIKYLVRLVGSKEKLYSVVLSLIDKRAKIEEYYHNWNEKTNDELLYLIEKNSEIKFNLLYGKLLVEILEKIKLINEVAAGQLKDTMIIDQVEEILSSFRTSDNFRHKLEILKKIQQLIFTGQDTIKKREYLKKRDGYESIIEDIESFDLWKKIKGELGDINDELNYIVFTKHLLAFFDEVIKIYDRKKETNNYLDFEDLLLKTTEIVKNLEVVEILAERYKYIMIDEYQDTNDTQYNIFMPILKHLQVNNLFVVGDEKQSIYFFRNADLEIFDTTKRLIKEKDKDGNLELTHSFRVSPKIALFTNKLFSKIMTENNTIFNEVEYSSLICARNPSESGFGNINFLLSEKEGSEAELVSKKIIEMLIKKQINNFNDVAVLCREKGDFEELEKSFTKFKINYSVIGGMGFYQNQMSSDLFHFLNFINNTNSDLSLVALLRSPFINLSDTQLTLISLEEGKTFYEKLKNYVKIDNSISNSVSLIDKCVKLFEFNEPDDILRLFLTESGYWGVIASRKSWQQEIANLEKFIQIVLHAFERSFFSYYDFLRQLDEYIESFDKENQAQVNSSYPAVKIMTIHKSKGLEFDTVILYNTSAKLKYSTLKAKDVKFDKEFGFIAKTPKLNDFGDEYITPVWSLLGERSIIKKETAEHKRVFYVAVTRAINNLIISCKIDSKLNFSNSFFSYIIKGLNPNLNEDRISVEGELDFLIDGIEQTKKQLNFDINITKSIDIDIENYLENSEKNIITSDKEFLLQEISDTPKYELFTASKYLAYKFCPIYYNLTYEYSYQKLIKLLNQKYEYDDFSKEDEIEINNDALRVGVVCHEILAEKVNINCVEEIIRRKVSKLLLSYTDSERIIDKVKLLLIPFLKSAQYSEINDYAKFYNEFEINKIVENYYFTGIIDRLIVKDDKIIIADYKTNNVNLQNIDSKIEYYTPQLKFYAYLAGSYFGWEKDIYIKLLFLAIPDYLHYIKVERKEIEGLVEELKQIINNIRGNHYISNTKNCVLCMYNNICKESILNKR